MTRNEIAQQIRQMAEELTDLMNRAQRYGLKPDINLSWENGCELTTSMELRMCKVWSARVTIDGLEINAPASA